MKFEKTDGCDLEQAIRNMRGRYYRKRNNKYEVNISSKVGGAYNRTYDTQKDAEEAVFRFRMSRFIEGIHKAGYNEKQCKIILGNYAVFPTGHIFNLQGCEILGGVDRAGYREVTLNGKRYRVHRVVAEAFIDNLNNLPCVNHKDGNKLNNCVDNLEWITYSDNTIHAYQNGLEKKCFGEKHHAHKLTADDVSYIKKVYKKRDEKYGAVALSAQYGVDRTTILDIIHGKTWRNVNATTI